MMLMNLMPGTATTLVQSLDPAAQDAASSTRSLSFLEVPEAWIVALVLVPALLAVAWLGYRSEPISARARGLLTGLRGASLLLLLLVLFRPVFEERREEVLPAEVLVLVDDSASMRRRDAYEGDVEARKAAQMLLAGSETGAPARGASGEAARLELARAIVERRLAPALRSGGYELRAFRFSDALAPWDAGASASGSGHVTYVGNALAQALAQHRGRHVTEVVVVSDGRSNGGQSPIDAARAAGAAGIPVHTVVVGDTRPERNLVLELLEAPATVLAGDEIAVAVRVTGRGLDEATTVEVLLEELDANGDVERLVAAEDGIAAGESGRRVVLVAPPALEGSRRGQRRFRVSVDPLPEETLRDDNAVELSVELTPERVRVLYVDAYPRWEYRYLKNLLLRADENLDVQCFLLSATADFLQESSEGLSHLAAIPTTRKELLENYDVILLGDLDPMALSPDPAKCEEFMRSLREFVERGGGLGLLAGEYDNPRSFVDTPLEELVPVVLDSSGATRRRSGSLTDAFRPRLEDPSNPHEIVRLHPDVATNRALWEDEGGLRGQYWWCEYVVRPKPGTQTLLRHPEASNAYGRTPLMVVGYFPSGRTLFLGLDSTWMWRFRFGDRYHERFWRNSIRWLALGRLRSGDRRVRIDSLKGTYDLGERVVLEARVLDEDFRPSNASTFEVRFEDPDGEISVLALERAEDRPGLFRRSFDVDRPGTYHAFVERDGRRSASAEFDVVLPSRENADPSPDPETLRTMSLVSQGKSVGLTDLDVLLREFPGGEERRQPISSQLEDAWDRWGTLLALLGLLATEWILRKRWELI